MKVTFTMNEPDPKKHSIRFHHEKVESVVDDGGDTLTGEELAKAPWVKGFTPSFYVPFPIGMKAKRIRVTIEEL